MTDQQPNPARQEWFAIPRDEFKPKPAMIYHALADSRLPVIVQFIPDSYGGHYNNLYTKRKMDKGLTHIMIPKELLHEYTT